MLGIVKSPSEKRSIHDLRQIAPLLQNDSADSLIEVFAMQGIKVKDFSTLAKRMSHEFYKAGDFIVKYGQKIGVEDRRIRVLMRG